MAKVSLSVSEIQEMCRLLEVWKTKLQNICSRIKSQVSRMEEWKDPQYELFKKSIEATYSQATLYIEQMQDLKKCLQEYAAAQNDARRQFSSDMNSSN